MSRIHASWPVQAIRSQRCQRRAGDGCSHGAANLTQGYHLRGIAATYTRAYQCITLRGACSSFISIRNQRSRAVFSQCLSTDHIIEITGRKTPAKVNLATTVEACRTPRDMRATHQISSESVRDAKWHWGPLISRNSQFVSQHLMLDCFRGLPSCLNESREPDTEGAVLCLNKKLDSRYREHEWAHMVQAARGIRLMAFPAQEKVRARRNLAIKLRQS
eukprot:6180019-Pleurochrysis_carterae.AAC.2